jgi:hypothetical protein
MSKLFTDFRFPAEFHHVHPRDFEDLQNYKASEYRAFALYGGDMFVMGRMCPEARHSWRMLTFALRVLSDKQTCHNRYMNALAREMIRRHIDSSVELYGHNYVAMCVHMLEHLPRECFEQDGPLDTFSAFPYENLNKSLRNICIRCPRAPMGTMMKNLKMSTAFVSKACRTIPSDYVSFVAFISNGSVILRIVQTS